MRDFRRQRNAGALAVALALALQGPGTAGLAGTPHLAGAPPPGPAVAAPATRAPAGAWAWPASGPDAVLEGFDPPPSPWAAGHRGVDLRAGPGSRVRSPSAGVVAFVGVVVDRPVVTVDHGNGLLSSFEPVAAGVSAGAAVLRGQDLGAVAAGGHCSGVCVHWGVRREGGYIDPLSFVMDRRPSILLPVPPGSG